MLPNYCIGVPGEHPRMLMYALNVCDVELQLMEGEVYFSQANFPDIPHVINEEGTELIAVILEDDVILQNRRDCLWEAAKILREAHAGSGCMTPKGRVDSTERSRALTTGATTAALIQKTLGQPFSIDWTMEDNTVVTHDATEMITMGMAVMQYYNACQAAGTAIREKLYDPDITTVEELEAVDLEEGYPE